MLLNQSRPVLLILGFGLTIVTGFADSQGFVGASRMWDGSALIWPELARSALGFTFGVLSYWLALRYLTAGGVVAAETQTLFWFGATIVGVAIASGAFVHWRIAEQVVALGVLAGIGWLLFHGGG